MNHFGYRDGTLHAEETSIADMAAAVGTPFYCYSTATLERHYRVFAAPFADLPATICYALKANSNIAVVRTFAALGAGADVVSGGELRQARAAGVPAERIVFSGVGKTAGEIAQGLDQGIMQFNVESLPELEAIAAIAEARGLRAPVALRVNPDVDARTHEKISTGMRHNKFGIPLGDVEAACARAVDMPGIELVGLAVHIGSQLTELGPYEVAYGRLADLVRDLRGRGYPMPRLDLGGGLGIRYRDETPPLPDAYAAMVKRATAGLDCDLILEPGRMIVGNAGVLVSRVVYVKESAGRRFVIVDAAMNDLPRPAMYGAYHHIEPVAEPAGDAVVAPADVVGPICESGDTFGVERPLPPVSAGDLVVFRSAGAYGAIMASSYNLRPLVPEVLVTGDRFAVVRRRPDYDEMVALEALPDWLSNAPARGRGAA
jgi:diaminopimelate decarboxylase